MTEIRHRSWQTEAGAAWFPWGIWHNGTEVAVAASINMAGTIARAYAGNGEFFIAY